MKRIWRVLIVSVALLALSALLYSLLYAVLPDRNEDIVFYTLLDVAFAPISVLIAGLLISGLLGLRDRRERRQRLNMVIGAFFSEAGTDLLVRLASFDGVLDKRRDPLVPKASWSGPDFAQARKKVALMKGGMDAGRADLRDFRDFLVTHRKFLLTLLQYPALHEHERFTDLLWAVLHIAEELSCRPCLDGLSAMDMKHLSSDIERAYQLLGLTWLDYLVHLKESYPYLFSLALRTNPLDPGAHPEIG